MCNFAAEIVRMMNLIRHFVKKYPYSCVCIALIWILSLSPFFPETPFDNVRFIDKWVHILMYCGTFTIVWLEYYLKHKSYDWEKLFFWGWLGPILMSGLLELLQQYCTGGHRNGDFLDLAANATGVTVAAVIGTIALKLGIRN